MNKLKLLKTAFTEGCVFYSISITAVYLLGYSVDSTWVPTLPMVLGLLAFSFLLGLADRFLFSDLLVFPLRLLLHYIGTCAAFWLLFGVMGGYEGSGLIVWLIYTFAYALILTIVSVYRWLTADLRNSKKEYTGKFGNDTYNSQFGG
ncbi:MAG: hypothetical protein IJ037_06335 [Clostridia bacterium]|nr:hypothetical protein [Clostridia bacterium]MBQ8369156.1 hypothetical protein [Clostridia bacterium]